MSTPDEYKMALDCAITEALDIPAATLDDAYAYQPDFNGWLFIALFAAQYCLLEEFHATGRPLPKNVARFTTKATKNKGGGSDASVCRTHSDFITACIEVSKVQDILPIVRVVKRAASNCVEGSILMTDHPKFVDKKNGKLTDLVYYTWLYDPRIGYMTELQIGVPSTFCVFSKNSEVREDKAMNPVMKELYKSYDKMKREVLAAANAGKD